MLKNLKNTWHQNTALRHATLALHAVTRDNNVEVLDLYENLCTVLTMIYPRRDFTLIEYIGMLFDQVEHRVGIRTFYLKDVPDEVSLEELVGETLHPTMPAATMDC